MEDFGGDVGRRTPGSGHLKVGAGFVLTQAPLVHRWWFIGLLTALVTVCASAHPLRAQAIQTALEGVDPGGNVTAVAISGQTLYVGGTFNSVAPVVGGGAIVDPIDGTLLDRTPRVAGVVLVSLPDGRGGWYVGGEFSGVGGEPRRNLAHIFGDGHVDAWAPDPDGAVYALALAGRTIFVGGAFTQLGGVQRPYVGAVDLDNGAATGWNPGADADVRALVVHGDDVLMGGWFTEVAGEPRPFLARVSARTGEVSPWAPTPSYPVFALASCGDTLFAGGAFFSIGNVIRPRLAAFDLRSGELTAWDAHIGRIPDYRFDLGPTVWALLVSGRRLFAAGAFNRVGSAVRTGLAALDVATAALDDWDPRVAMDTASPFPAAITSLGSDGTSLYVAGLMDSLAGSPAHYAGAIDSRTASRLPWDPRTNSFVETVSTEAGRVFIGGQFTSLGASALRQGLAAFDLRTGLVTPWNPGTDGQPLALAVYRGTIYVGGNFGRIGGAARSGLAAIDSSSGIATTWDPACNGAVDALAIGDSSVFVAGSFNAIGGDARSGLAEVDLQTGSATPWNPQPNDVVTTIARHGGLIYAGGWFTSIGTAARNHVAAIDPRSGLATPWNPGVNALVNCLALQDTTVYLGGYFTQIAGVERDGFGAASTISGEATALRADVDQNVKAIAIRESILCIAGAFKTVGGVRRSCLAALEKRTGNILDWDPSPDQVVWAITSDDDRVYPVGAFTSMGTLPASHIAGVALADPARAKPHPEAHNFVDFVGVTSPCRTSGYVHFELRQACLVKLHIYDMQGRQVRVLLEDVPLRQGHHEIPVVTHGWRPGFYFYRLTGGSDTAVKKMVVLP